MSFNPRIQLMPWSDEELKNLPENYPNIRKRYRISGVDTVFINALRRACSAYTPTLAVDQVSITRNDTPLPDEMIVHRLAMIPFESTETELMNYKWDCDCDDGCNRCMIEFKLDVTNTKTLGDGSGDLSLAITSNDLYPIHTNAMPYYPLNHPDSKRKEVMDPLQVVDAPCLITKLPYYRGNPNDLDRIHPPRIALECRVRKGFGLWHGKYCPVSEVAYQPVPIIKLHPRVNDMELNEKQALVNICPQKVFSIDPLTNRVYIPSDNELNCTYCDSCVVMAPPPVIAKDAEISGINPQVVTVSPVDNDFVFTIETTGVMSCEEIIVQATHAIEGRFKHLIAELPESTL